MFSFVQGYLKNLYPFLAGSCMVLFVGIVAQLCWPRTLRGKRLSQVSSPQSFCSDIRYLDASEVVIPPSKPSVFATADINKLTAVFSFSFCDCYYFFMIIDNHLPFHRH
jgi:hypothetical protein